jgi:HEAT repeat protein
MPRPLEELRPALQADARDSKIAAARSLRKSLLAFPERLAESVRLLRDTAAPVDLRRAIAVVLGTLPGREGKRAILEALRDGETAGLERTVILALGAAEFDDGLEFERDDQPHSIQAAPGLAVFVMGPLEDPEARAEVGKYLAVLAADERRAAARVLRDSTGFPDVRRGFLDRLGSEPDGETLAEEAAALCRWTGKTARDDPERGAVLGRILDGIADSEEIVRFRLTSPLSSVELLSSESGRLRELAGSASPDARAFACDVLGRRLGFSDVEDRDALPLLSKAAVSDPDSFVRKTAAVALSRLAQHPEVLRILTTVLQGDTEWSVRASAARALSNAGSAARPALEAAARSDPNPEVRTAAQRALPN